MEHPWVTCCHLWHSARCSAVQTKTNESLLWMMNAAVWSSACKTPKFGLGKASHPPNKQDKWLPLVGLICLSWLNQV